MSEVKWVPITPEAREGVKEYVLVTGGFDGMSILRDLRHANSMRTHYMPLSSLPPAPKPLKFKVGDRVETLLRCREAGTVVSPHVKADWRVALDNGGFVFRNDDELTELIVPEFEIGDIIVSHLGDVYEVIDVPTIQTPFYRLVSIASNSILDARYPLGRPLGSGGYRKYTPQAKWH